MRTVEFFKTTPKGSMLIGTVSFGGKELKFEVPLWLVLDLSGGIVGRAKGGTVYPKDGVKFFNELQYAFTGSYLRASEVKEVAP